jgi:hypothetical protein
MFLKILIIHIIIAAFMKNYFDPEIRQCCHFFVQLYVQGNIQQVNINDKQLQQQTYEIPGILLF